MLSPVDAPSLCQTGCLFLLGLAGDAWVLLYNLTSTLRQAASPTRPEAGVSFCDATCSFVQHTPRGREQLQPRQFHRLLLAGLFQQCLSGLGELDTGNQAELLFVTLSRSLGFSS